VKDAKSAQRGFREGLCEKKTSVDLRPIPSDGTYYDEGGIRKQSDEEGRGGEFRLPVILTMRAKAS
jgi:hypothetical protein